MPRDFSSRRRHHPWHIVWLLAVLATLNACAPAQPWDDLSFTDINIPATLVFRAPNDRLCGFLDGRFNQDGSLLSPGSITCDNGALGAPELLVTGSTATPGVSVPGALGPAFIFSAQLSRFDKAGALVTSALPVPQSTVVGVDSEGRVLSTARGALARHETDGGTTTLLNGPPPSTLLIAPDNRLYVTAQTASALVSEIVDGKVVPVVSCPTAMLPTCSNPIIHGIDGRGSIYFSNLDVQNETVTMTYARVDADRSLHRLPDGPRIFRPNGGIAPCAVTPAGTLVCAYHLEANDTDNYASHYELISLPLGAATWRRFGKIPEIDTAPFYLAARDNGDCLVGRYSGGFGRLLELRGYRYR